MRATSLILWEFKTWFRDLDILHQKRALLENRCLSTSKLLLRLTGTGAISRPEPMFPAISTLPGSASSAILGTTGLCIRRHRGASSTMS